MSGKKKRLTKARLTDKLEVVKKECEESNSDQESFDFGGFPKHISLKKNIGCGG